MRHDGPEIEAKSDVQKLLYYNIFRVNPFNDRRFWSTFKFVEIVTDQILFTLWASLDIFLYVNVIRVVPRKQFSFSFRRLKFSVSLEGVK